MCQKIQLNNLIIEVTRRCNMQCEHCLRGDAEDLDQSVDNINTLLDGVDYIGSVTFTGGEPSLNVPIIEHFIDECKLNDIIIGSFYIATNGLKIEEPFIIACLKLYAMSDEKEMCRVDISNDVYHAYEGSYNTELLEGLSFVNRKYSEEGYDYNSGRDVISEGRGADAGGLRENHPFEPPIDEDELQDTEWYLNCHGDIINGCDWSYDTQDSEEFTLCSVDELKSFVLNIQNESEK